MRHARPPMEPDRETIWAARDKHNNPLSETTANPQANAPCLGLRDTGTKETCTSFQR
jgi:hypothetical protein